MKKRVLTIISALLSLALTVAPALAATPTVNGDVWFVAAGIAPPSEPGETWWTGDGTVLHKKGEIQPNWNIFRSPAGPGSVLIGSMISVMEEFVFNTESGKGHLTLKVTLAFTEADSTKNPYGVGTFEGTLVAEVTTLHPMIVTCGDGTGFVVATQGTGAFESAKLTADLVIWPFAVGGQSPSLFIFFGTHPKVGGSGIIVYH